MKANRLFPAVIFAAMCCGCAVDQAYVPQKVQPLAPAPAPVRVTTQSNANFSIANEVNTKLRVSFRWNAAEQQFCAKLAERLAGKIIPDSAELELNSDGDMMIILRPEFEAVDRTGEYYRVDCKQISATIVSRDKVYAIKNIEPDTMPRKLGEQNAKDQYLNPAVEALSPFLKNELNKLSNELVTVSIIDFALVNPGRQPNSQDVAAQVNKITQILSSTNGVINFFNIRQDVVNATCSFRVVYLKKQFPQGIVNVLNLKLDCK